MKSYASTEVVEAMRVGDLHRHTISEKKAGKVRIKSGDKDSVDLGDVFVDHHNVSVGDYVIFRDGQPSTVMSASSFEQSYEQLATPPKAKKKK